MGKIWFDIKLNILSEKTLTDFLSHYYNSAEKWGRPVVATYKSNDFEKGAGISNPAKGDILWGVDGWSVKPPSGAFMERKGTSAVIRSYWTYGKTLLGAGWGGWGNTGGVNPSGRIMSLTKDRIYGYGRKTYVSGATGHRNNVYRLYALLLPTMSAQSGNTTASTAADAKKEQAAKRRGAPSKSKKPTKNYLWERDILCTVRAMVATPSALIVAGVPDIAKRSGEMGTDGRAHNRLEFANPEEALAAFDGKKGGELYFVSLNEGKIIKKMSLPASPRHDGMIVANGQIVISLKNGEVLCLAEKE